MPTPYIGRLAPSPTGLLHLGHARTFWTAYQRARAAHGTLYLRDDDVDPHRSRAEFSSSLREDLCWLGITWDAEVRQSERLSLYRAAMQQLLATGLAYPCTCSRNDLAHATQAPHEEDDEPLYNNHCRPIAIEPQTTLLPNVNYRLRTPDHQPIAFTDLHAGPQSFTPAVDFGDFLIWRKDALPSYQLACVVDDADLRITEVVRGRDLLKSTARQILLQRVLNLSTPAYFHCDLLRDEAGVRLAKRHHALSLRTLRANGLSPAEVIVAF